MTIHLTIDRLILDGFAVDRSTAGQIRTAVEAELSQLLATSAFATSLAGGAMPSIVAPAIQYASTDSPRAIGAAIAQSVHGGLYS